MNKQKRIFCTSVAVLCALGTTDARAVNAPTVMSKYGEIQSVNKYSSNPFWTPSSPYNQRFPTPIYATGPDLNTETCNNTVGALIASFCSSRNNCENTQLSDIRPYIMVELSQLPGHNYATSCGGYIDAVFQNYKKAYGNTSTNNIVKPASQSNTTVQIANPFQQQKSEYEIGVAERAAELERMQNITTPTATVHSTSFPKTIDDLSFTDRLANTTAGYEPYKNLNAYKTPKFETEQEYNERMKSVLEHNIRYETFGGNATGCPTKYLTNTGATISCIPTRDHSVFVAWCTNSELTANCAKTHTISKNDHTDKTFFAKWDCAAGYKLDANRCIDPNGGSPDGGYNPADVPQCLKKISTDNKLISEINSKMAGAAKVNADELKSRQLYAPLAQFVYDYCVGERIANAQELSDFNRWLDGHDILPITFNINNKEHTLEFNAEELFGYFTGNFIPILVQRTTTINSAGPQSKILKSELATDKISSSCATNFYRYGNMAGAFERFIGISGLQSAASAAYNYPYAIYYQQDSGIILYRTDNVVVDVLLPVGPVAGKNKLVYDTNYAAARKKIKAFVEGLKSTACANQNLAVFLVMPKDKDISEILVKSEPFFI